MALRSPPLKVAVAGDVPPAPPRPLTLRIDPPTNAELVSVALLSESSGLVLVSVPPFATVTTSELVVRSAPDMLRSGPARVTLAGAGAPELLLVPDTLRIRPIPVPPRGLGPPTVSDPPFTLMSGELVVLLKLEA